MMNLQNVFNPKLEVPLNTIVTSDAITFNASGYIKDISGNVTIYKNSIAQTSPVSFTSLDSITLSITSSSQNADQTFGVVEVNTGTPTTHIFACVTSSAIESVPQFMDLEPFELTAYANGSTYVPDSSKNAVGSYLDLADSIADNVTNLSNNKPLASNTEGYDNLIFCSFFTGKVQRIDLSTNEIVGIIDVPGKPYAALGVPKIPRQNYITDLWVTLSDKDKVVVINENDTIVREFSVGKRPLGICADSQHENIFVANSYDDTVTKFKWNMLTLDWEVTTINVGLKPYEIVCDVNGNAWVTCAADNKVYRINVANQVTSFVVGKNPRGIAYNNQKIWIAISQEAKLIALNLDGTVAHELSNIGSIPFSVGAIPLPVKFTTNIVDIINIIDQIRATVLSEIVSFSDSISSNRATDSLDTSKFVDVVALNKIVDSVNTSNFVDSITLNKVVDSFDTSKFTDVITLNKVVDSLDTTIFFESVKLNRITDSLTIGESVSPNIIKDSISIVESFSPNIIKETITFTETLNVKLTAGEKPIEIVAIDADFEYVSLLLTGEIPS